MYFDPRKTGMRIRNLRKQKQLTQEQLAEKLNISVNYLGKLEAGQYAGSIDLLVEMTQVFEVTLDYLVMGIAPSDTDRTKDVLKKKLLILIEFLKKFIEEL